MIHGRTRVILWLAATTIVLLLIAAIAMPTIISALPGRVRQYLPTELAAQTPVPLPTPNLVPDIIALNVPAEPAIQPTPTVVAITIATLTSPMATPESATLIAPEPIASPTFEPTPSYPPSVYIEGVEIIPQKFNNCGATNLAMVLNYHNIDVDQFDIAAIVRPTYEDRNVSPNELASYVSDYTELEARVVSGGDQTLLKQLLAAGLPVIIEQGLIPDEEVGWMGHYLTLYGYNEADRSFFARDSFLGPWEEDGRATYDSVAELWPMFNSVFIVAYPPDRQAEVSEIIGESLSDPVVMWQRAAEMARAGIRQNGTDAFSWFNLGTSLLALEEYAADPAQLQQAVASFDQARLLGLPPRMLWYQFGPYEAYLKSGRMEDVLALADATLSNQGGRSVEETYIYRALALQARGDTAEAARDFLRAEQVNPTNPLLLQARSTQP